MTQTNAWRQLVRLNLLNISAMMSRKRYNRNNNIEKEEKYFKYQEKCLSFREILRKKV